MTCYYLGFFVAGILLAQHKELLVNWVSILSKRVALMYLGVALLLYWYGTPAVMVLIQYGLKATTVKLIGYDWVCGVGALMLIILGLGFPHSVSFCYRKSRNFSEESRTAYTSSMVPSYTPCSFS